MRWKCLVVLTMALLIAGGAPGRSGGEPMNAPNEELFVATPLTKADAATARYRRLRDYSVLVTTALRHADAMGRLEMALQLA